MSRARLIDYYIEKSNDPDFKINQIRQELESRNIPDEEIRIVVRLIDDEILKRALTKSASKTGNELIIAGIILTIVGAGITLGTYTKLINIGDSYLIVYGPFFSGLSILFSALAQKRK